MTLTVVCSIGADTQTYTNMHTYDPVLRNQASAWFNNMKEVSL